MDYWVLLDERLDMSQECLLDSQRAKSILGCIKRSTASRSREAIASAPLHSHETPPGVLHSVLGPPTQEGHEALEASPEKGHRDDQGAGASLL
ncbi:hypothetical protein BTVI_24840 [Pitangus sulphuratus]|nr:hypothetical protein BTVI_24840 [Pitangus sulphuratus]